MQNESGAFWEDLAEDLKDPEFLREYVVESVRIATIDRIVNELDDARVAADLSKAALARAIRDDHGGASGARGREDEGAQR